MSKRVKKSNSMIALNRTIETQTGAKLWTDKEMVEEYSKRVGHQRPLSQRIGFKPRKRQSR